MTTSDVERDTVLLKAILSEDLGTIANIVQAASELEELDDSSMSGRLAAGYWELTNKDPGAETDVIGFRQPEEEE